jgi:hypothetical protein
LERLAQLADRGGEHRALCEEAAEMIRQAGEYRWVGLYEVTETEAPAIACPRERPARLRNDPALGRPACFRRRTTDSTHSAVPVSKLIEWTRRCGITTHRRIDAVGLCLRTRHQAAVLTAWTALG